MISHVRAAKSMRPISLTGYTKPSRIAKVFVAVLLIVVFEGAFRKWLSPALTMPLVLLRDCLVVYGVLLAIKNKKMRFSQLGTQALSLWTVIVLVWGLMQFVVHQNSPLVFMVGIRFWLLYLWFAYAASVSLTQDDFRYITKAIFWLLLLMVPLAVVQFYLPPSAFLNKQIEEGRVFTVTKDIVRTTGTFSFTAGYTTLLAIFTPFVLSTLLPGTRLFRKTWMPKVLLLALAIGTIVSGSRTAIVMFGFMFAIYIFVALRYSRTAKRGNSMLMLVSVFFMIAIVTFIFSRAVDVTQERFETASQGEDFVTRVKTIFVGELDIYENLSLIGAGIGAGSNFAGTEAGTQFLLGETEADRTILEGGMLGIFYIILKLLLITLGIKRALFIAKRTGNPLPLLIWATLAIALLTWSIIGQLTVNALGFLLLGLGIAALRLGKDPLMGQFK